MDMKGLVHGVALLFAIFSSTALFAQDISGDYDLSASETGGSGCTWDGPLSLTQSGGNPGTFVGSATASIVTGPCPGFSGSVSGNINGTTIDFGVAIGGGGSADFAGTVSGGSLSGTWSASGITGTWSAAPVATTTTTTTAATTTTTTAATTTTTAISPASRPVPALGAFGIPLLAAIMVVIGLLGFSRRR